MVDPNRTLPYSIQGKDLKTVNISQNSMQQQNKEKEDAKQNNNKDHEHNIKVQ